MPKGRYIDWKPWDHTLGKTPDPDIARKIGCSDGAVRCRRAKLGIKPFFYPVWSQKDEDLLSQCKQKCVVCNLIKDLNDKNFSKHPTSKDGRRNRCCRYCDLKRQREFRRNRKRLIVNKAGGKCQNCEHSEYLSCLQFHHVEGPKLFNPSGAVCGSKKQLQVIFEEIKKCCLLCSNCHDAYHGGELELKFKKQSTGWTVSNPRRSAHLQNCPTEDKGLTNELSV